MPLPTPSAVLLPDQDDWIDGPAGLEKYIRRQNDNSSFGLVLVFPINHDPIEYPLQ